MDTGKIMIGFSLILLTFAMIISPSGATLVDGSCDAGFPMGTHTDEAGDPASHGSGPRIMIGQDASHTIATNPYER